MAVSIVGRPDAVGAITDVRRRVLAYEELSDLLDRIKSKVRDYSVPAFAPFDAIDRRFNIDPQLQRQIKYATVVVCSNRSVLANP